MTGIQVDSSVIFHLNLTTKKPLNGNVLYWTNEQNNLNTKRRTPKPYQANEQSVYLENNTCQKYTSRLQKFGPQTKLVREAMETDGK